jgi:choline dehydrogenase
VESAGEYDYIIVGAGTAGCVLANRLTRDKNIEVLLIEAGGRDDYMWIHIPVGYLYCIGNPRTDWLFNTEPDPGLGGRALIYPTCVGNVAITIAGPNRPATRPGAGTMCCPCS